MAHCRILRRGFDGWITSSCGIIRISYQGSSRALSHSLDRSSGIYFWKRYFGLPRLFFGFVAHTFQTLPSKCLAKAEKLHLAKNSVSSSSTLRNDDDVRGQVDPSVQPRSICELLSDPVIRAIGGSGFALAFLAGGHEVIFVLYCFSSIENGGLGFPVSSPAPALLKFLPQFNSSH